MKNLFVILLSLGWVISVQAQSPLSMAATPVSEADLLSWKSAAHYFGEIKYQQPQSVSFTFTNNAAQPVVITEAKGSCGCTVASYTKEPIGPGEVGTVKATYNAAKLGAFNKTVAVKTTANDEWKHLKITGIVVE